MERSEPRGLDPELLEILACPKCKGALRQEGDVLVCERCRLRFRIQEGIPVLLLEKAEEF